MEEEIAVVNSSVPNVSNDVTSYANNEAPFAVALPARTLPSAVQKSDAPDEIMSRTRKLTSYIWSSATAFGTIHTFYPGSELLSSLASIVRVVDFTYISYKGVRLRFTPNTTKFYRGMLGITFVPAVWSRNNAFAYTPTALSSLPTTYLDASSCTAVEYVYPWSSIRSKDRYDALNSGLGHLVLWVLDPLCCETAPGEVASISVNIEASFEDPHLQDPNTNFSVVPTVPARVTNTQPAGSFAYAQANGVNKEARMKAEKGTISSALDSTSKIAAKVSSFPVIGEFAGGLAVMAKAASRAFDFLGLAKPLNLSTPTFTIRNPLPFSATLDGVISAEPLSAEQLPFVATEPSFVAADVDECALEYLLKRPSLIARYTTGPVPGDTPVLLGAFPVAPSYGWITNPNFYSASNLGAVATAFETWRGDLAFKFIVPGNPLNRCRLAIMYSITKQAVFSESNRFMYVDVEGTTVIDGVIPWTVNVPFRPLPIPNLATNSNQSNNGYLHVFQVSALIADSPSVAPQPLSVLVFACATPNLQFAGMRNPTQGKSLALGVALPNGFLGLDSSVHIDRLLAEDNIKSLRQMMHRLYSVGPFTLTKGVTTTPNVTIPFPHQWFLYMFRFWRGSITFTITNSYLATNTAKAITIWPSDKTQDDTAVIWYPELQPRIQITLPFLEPAGALDTGSFYTAQLPGLLSFFHADPTNNYDIFIHLSFNDDLSLGVPVPPRYMALV